MDFSDRYRHRERIWQHRPTDGWRDICARAEDHLVVFLHLAKTGGVTMSEIINRGIEPDQFLQVENFQADRSALGTWSPAIIAQSYEKLSAGDASRIKYIWGHFGPAIQSVLPKPAHFFTMLREPIDRIVSGFYYSTGGEMVDTDGQIITLADYANRKRPYDLGIDNYMTRVLSGNFVLDPERGAHTGNSWLVTDEDLETAIRTLDSCLLVGRLEQFDETLVVLAAHLRWSLSDMVYDVMNITRQRPPIADIPPPLCDAIHEWNSFDAKLVARGAQLLAQQIKAYPGNFERDLSLFRNLNVAYRSGMPASELQKLELQSTSRHD